jgi:AbrB family looped-hinge helix DNA binding protein
VDVTVVVGKQGRVVLPAEVRAALGIQPGDRLHLHLSGRQLVVQRPADAVEQLRGLAGGVASSRSLVEELLDERRRETAGR